MGIIIDTCIWIEVERGRLSPADVALYTQEEPVFLSPVTLAELNYGVEVSKKNPVVYHQRLAALARLRKKPCLSIDVITGEIFGQLAAHLAQPKRGHHFRVQDLWLASQAIQHSMELLTYNEKDFKDIPGLNLVVVPISERPIPPKERWLHEEPAKSILDKAIQYAAKHPPKK